MASLLPSCISSGVMGMPRLVAILVTLSRLGFAEKAEVSLWRDCYAFMRPYNWDAGSSFEIDASYCLCYSALLVSAWAIAWSIWAYISAAFNLAYSTVSSSSSREEAIWTYTSVGDDFLDHFTETTSELGKIHSGWRLGRRLAFFFLPSSFLCK